MTTFPLFLLFLTNLVRPIYLVKVIFLAFQLLRSDSLALKPFGRVESIDIVRGFAILSMMFWHIFDFFWKGNVYTDAPFVISFMQAPPNFYVVALFTAMSGASLYLSMKSKRKKGMAKMNLFKYVFVRYGKFVIFSLFFTTFIFGFCTYVKWEEAVQGITLTAIFASLPILVIDDKKHLSLFLMLCALIFFIAQPVGVRNSWISEKNYPYCKTSSDITYLPTSIAANALFYGFFSVFRLLPFFMLGALLGIAAEKGYLKENHVKVIGIGILFAMLSFVIYYLNLRGYFGQNFSFLFYSRTYPSLILECSIVIILMGLAEYTIKHKTIILKQLSDFVLPFGKYTLMAYFGHFMLMYKPIEIVSKYTQFKILDSFGYNVSFTMAVLGLLLFREMTVLWLEKR